MNTKEIYEYAEKYVTSHPDFEAEGLSDYQNGRLNGYIDGAEAYKAYVKPVIEQSLSALQKNKGRAWHKFSEPNGEHTVHYENDGLISKLIQLLKD